VDLAALRDRLTSADSNQLKSPTWSAELASGPSGLGSLLYRPHATAVLSNKEAGPKAGSDSANRHRRASRQGSAVPAGAGTPLRGIAPRRAHFFLAVFFAVVFLAGAFFAVVAFLVAIADLSPALPVLEPIPFYTILTHAATTFCVRRDVTRY
jgi:hypothetical protein